MYNRLMYQKPIGTIGYGRRRVVRRRRGGDFLGLGNFFGRTLPGAVGSALPAIHNIVKSTGAISKLAGFIPGVGGIASTGARLAGYGRRRAPRRAVRRGGMRRRAPVRRVMRRMPMRRRRGGNAFMNAFTKAKNWAKEKKFISKTIGYLGQYLPTGGLSHLAKFAKTHGYGRRPVRRVARRRVGGRRRVGRPRVYRRR
jgi:hypothetical protein